MRLRAHISSWLGIFSILVLLPLFAHEGRAQSSENQRSAVVRGKVCDAGGPLSAAIVSLEKDGGSQNVTTTSDAEGNFRFIDVPAGTYTLRAKLSGYQGANFGPFVLSETESKLVAVQLAKVPSAASSDVAANMEFSVEPQFTVAGVTDTTNLGGHGSATFMRNRDALSKETAALAKEGGAPPNDSSIAKNAAPAEAALRELLQQHETADLHAQLAEIEESKGRPLEAVRDYQRAAEMDPSEPHLFVWGAELLLHHAYEPAIEVFGKGRRLYPRSVRTLLGLGAARYAQGTREQAVQTLLQASDLDPADPNPYLFLGRLEAIENIEVPGWLERVKRFVTLHPENAMAHYLYAVALSKQGVEQASEDSVESHLKTAVQLDAHLGSAYLQLGILYAQRKDFPGATVAFQRAIENTPVADEAHYRLAQVYRAMGNSEGAREETQLFKQVTEQRRQQAERERHEIPQFVYTLRSQSSSGPTSRPQ